MALKQKDQTLNVRVVKIEGLKKAIRRPIVQYLLSCLVLENVTLKEQIKALFCNDIACKNVD